jgi:hypothetical protein
LPLRHREDLVVRRIGRQEEERREAPRQALRRAPRLQVVSRLLRALDDLGRAAAGAVEAENKITGRSLECAMKLAI